MSLREEAEALEQEIIGHRRHLHAHPELSFEEKETTAYLEGELRKLGLTPHRYPDYYGVWADIQGAKKVGADDGKGPGQTSEGDTRTVALRADIDALPIQEETGLPFASERENVMHACGHDNHAAMLLGAAKLLLDHRADFAGTVRLLFQAAEESCHGAVYYVNHGLLDDVDAIYGCHVWSTLDAPYLNVESGPRMCSCDNFTITVKGKAAHGSAPNDGIDAIVAAAAIILQLQTIASRRKDPRDSLTVTIGEIVGGPRFNVISDQVVMKGTVRTLSSKLRGQVEGWMREIAGYTARANGAEAILEYDYDPGVLINDPELTRIARDAAVKLYGKDILREQPTAMGSEDFSYFLEKVPGVYAFLGARSQELGYTASNHNSHFTVDESILKRGAALYAQFALDYLNEPIRQTKENV